MSAAAAAAAAVAAASAAAATGASRVSVAPPAPPPPREREGRVVKRLFSFGLSHVLDSGEFSDVTVVFGGRTYAAHKLVLAYSSEFFERSFLADFQERDSNTVHLLFEDPVDVFPTVLQFMYDDPRCEITEDKVIALLVMADQLLISSLRQRCMAVFLATLKRETALSYLKRAVEFGFHDVFRPCLKVIAKSFYVYEPDDFSFLPQALFLELLRDEQLAVKSEKSVFDAVAQYVNTHEGSATPVPEATRRALFELVRYPWMSYDHLVEAQQCPFVPQGLLVEGLMSRLRRFEGPKGGPEAAAPPAPQPQDALALLRHTRRPPYSIRLDYKEDFGESGVLYWLGTRGGTAEWRNPVHLHEEGAGGVAVTVSSIEKGDLSSFVSREPVESWTRDVPASWLAIDLGPQYSLQPSQYTLRHGGNYKADSLRNWDLQGSSDGVNWTVLRRHGPDSSLNGPFATHTWTIEDATSSYRHFRILQTGHNSSRHNFLVVCGFELFGDLYIHTPPE